MKKNKFLVIIGNKGNFAELNDEILLTDAEIFDSQETLKAIASNFEKSGGTLVTRNALLLNMFTDDFAVENFVVWNANSNSYIKFFDDENLIKKLKFLGSGEVVADSIEL